MNFNREDILWAAGLFEGEGCIDHHKIISGRIYPRIKLKMCDKDIVERFGKIFDLKVREVTKDKSWKDHYKDAWYVLATGSKAIAIIYMLYSFLGTRRKQKAEEVLSAWRKNDLIPVKVSNQCLKRNI